MIHEYWVLSEQYYLFPRCDNEEITVYYGVLKEEFIFKIKSDMVIKRQDFQKYPCDDFIYCTNNLALIRVEKPAEYNGYVKPIPLASKPHKPEHAIYAGCKIPGHVVYYYEFLDVHPWDCETFRDKSREMCSNSGFDFNSENCLHITSAGDVLILGAGEPVVDDEFELYFLLGNDSFKNVRYYLTYIYPYKDWIEGEIAKYPPTTTTPSTPTTSSTSTPTSTTTTITTTRTPTITSTTASPTTHTPIITSITAPKTTATSLTSTVLNYLYHDVAPFGWYWPVWHDKHSASPNCLVNKNTIFHCLLLTRMLYN